MVVSFNFNIKKRQKDHGTKIITSVYTIFETINDVNLQESRQSESTLFLESNFG